MSESSEVAIRRRFSLEGKLTLLFTAVLALMALVAGVLSAVGAPPALVTLGTLAIGVPIGIVVLGRVTRPMGAVLGALKDGVQGFRSGDFSLHLAVARDDELGELVAIYNTVVATLREERGAIRQRELLLTTALDSSPVAVILLNAAARVVFSNRAAGELFDGHGRLDGHAFADVAGTCAPAVRDALMSSRDTLVELPIDGANEVYQVSRRRFELNAQRHQLVLVRRLTVELRRQEMAAYKKLIRALSHELNNALAPISSLIHSSRLLVDRPDAAPRLLQVFDTIDDCTTRLRRYVDGYAELARLPAPRLESVDVAAFLAQLRMLEPFTIDGEPGATRARFDPSQIQHVLLNLLRNAREAGSDVVDIVIATTALPDGGIVVDVADRGAGMRPEVMQRALLPFYSTKATGTGLGLALCREIVEAHGGRISLTDREGGGLMVRCRICPSADGDG